MEPGRRDCESGQCGIGLDCNGYTWTKNHRSDTATLEMCILDIASMHWAAIWGVNEYQRMQKCTLYSCISISIHSSHVFPASVSEYVISLIYPVRVLPSWLKGLWMRSSRLLASRYSSILGDREWKILCDLLTNTAAFGVSRVS